MKNKIGPKQQWQPEIAQKCLKLSSCRFIREDEHKNCTEFGWFSFIFEQDFLLRSNLEGQQTVDSCRQTQQWYISYLANL